VTGDYPAAAQALEQALGIFRDIGDRGGEAEALTRQGRCTGSAVTLHRLGHFTSRPWNWPGPSPASGPRRTRWPAWAAADVSAELDAATEAQPAASGS
jgi:hypothetical protein